MKLQRHTAKYIQVAEYLRVMIRRQKLEQGTPLPSDHELSAKFECSRGAVRHAMALLSREGLVQRKQGAGTFVGRPYTGRGRKLLGAIIPNITNTEFSGFVQTLGLTARAQGYSLLLGVTGEAIDLERDLIREFGRLGVLGAAKFPTQIEVEDDTRALLRSQGVPFVIVNDFWTASQSDYLVGFDECAAVKLAVDHLVELGHRRIVLVDNVAWLRTRLIDAFFNALAGHDLPHDEDRLLLYDLATVPPVEKLYGEDGPRPTALISIYGVAVPSLLLQLREFEIWVPRDVSVVNINGTPAGLPAGVDLTTVVPPNRKMAEQVLDLLVNGLEKDHVRHYIYEPEFHVGNTSGPCREECAGQLAGQQAAAAPV